MKKKEKRKYVAMRYPESLLIEIDIMAVKANRSRTAFINDHFNEFQNLKRKLKNHETRYGAGNLALLEQFFGI